jgi:hypothetical protein
MIRAYRVALTAMGLAVLMVVLARVVPPPEPEGRARPEPDGSAAIESTIALTVPEGELAGTLNVVDASGRALASLTYFSDGDIALVARPDGRAGLSCWLSGKGAARMQMTGTVRVTNIEMDPDGMTRTSTTERRTTAKALESGKVGWNAEES